MLRASKEFTVVLALLACVVWGCVFLLIATPPSPVGGTVDDLPGEGLVCRDLEAVGKDDPYSGITGSVVLDAVLVNDALDLGLF